VLAKVEVPSPTREAAPSRRLASRDGGVGEEGGPTLQVGKAGELNKFCCQLLISVARLQNLAQKNYLSSGKEIADSW